jgi:hypothetical protein
MNTTTNVEQVKQELRQLRRQERMADLRLRLAAKRSALRAVGESQISNLTESYYDPNNYVDLRDYLGPGNDFAQPMVAATRGDRQEGRNRPIFWTEGELAAIRGMARILRASSPTAVCAFQNLTNYVIGTGYDYTVGDRGGAPARLVRLAQRIIDDFLEENNFCGDLDGEMFERLRRDGERALAMYHTGDGHVRVRLVEPEQITEPADPRLLDDWLANPQPSCWSFGVHSDEHDLENIHGYYCQWTDTDTDWDYLPGGPAPLFPPQSGRRSWLDLAKCNVDRKIKRGLSDLYAVQQHLQDLGKLERNVIQGAAVLSAIVGIRQHPPGASRSQIENFVRTYAYRDRTQPTPNGNRTRYVQRIDPGSWLDVPHGQQYRESPLATQGVGQAFVTIEQGILRTIGRNWCMPEYMISADSGSTAYASLLVAESPFVKYCEATQHAESLRHRRILWRVLWFAWQAGLFGSVNWQDLRRSLRIQVQPPEITNRRTLEETSRREVLHDQGVLSTKTWAGKEGLDYQQEQEAGARRRTSLVPDTPMRSLGDLPRQGGQKSPLGPQAAQTNKSRYAEARRLLWENYP